MEERREEEAEFCKRSRTTTSDSPSSSLRCLDRSGKMEEVWLVCGCRDVEEFSSPCRECHCRKRTRLHLHSVPSKKVLFSSTDADSAASVPSQESTETSCSYSFQRSSSDGSRSPENGGNVKKNGDTENTANVHGTPRDISQSISYVKNPTPEADASIRKSFTDNMQGASVAHGGSFAGPAAAGSVNYMSPNGKAPGGLNVSPISPQKEIPRTMSSGQSLTPENNKAAANPNGWSPVSSVLPQQEILPSTPAIIPDEPMPDLPSENERKMKDNKNSVTVLSGDNVAVTREGDVVNFCFKCPCGLTSQANCAYKWS